MRQHPLLLATILMMGGLSVPAFGQAMDPKTAPTADKNPTAAPDADDIRETIADATENAVEKNGFDNLVKAFVDADRNRIGKHKLSDDDWAKLNGRIAQINKAWKAKYDKDFDIDEEEVVYNSAFRIVQGEIGDPDTAGDKVDRGAPDTTPDDNSNKVGGGDTNRDVGRNVAKMRFPASHGLPELFIPMIHELPDSWKIDVPDEVDGQKLYDNLLNQLTLIGETSDQWPADVNDAYRLVSHRVLMAVLNHDAAPFEPGAKPDLSKRRNDKVDPDQAR